MKLPNYSAVGGMVDGGNVVAIQNERIVFEGYESIKVSYSAQGMGLVEDVAFKCCTHLL